MTHDEMVQLVVLETRAYVRGKMGQEMGSWEGYHKNMELMVPILLAYTEGADEWRSERGLPSQIEVAREWARWK